MNNTGGSNSFFGSNSGVSNTTGIQNSFFGGSSGDSTTTGSNNSFFGEGSGGANTTGFSNTLVGTFAGNANTTGSNNTIIGSNADVSLTNLTFATAIGAGATVGSSNTVVLGRSADVVVAPNRLLISNANDETFALQVQGGAAFLGTATVQTSRLRILSPPNPGATAEPLCLNTAMREVTFCDAQLNKTNEAGDQSLITEINEQKKTIGDLQQQIEALKKLICQLIPSDEICK